MSIFKHWDNRYPNFPAIYVIRNITNNHRYIGSTLHYRHRIQIHINELKNNKHHSQYLQNAWNKYGSQCFEFKLFYLYQPKSITSEKLREIEQNIIDAFKPEYNMNPIACNPPILSPESIKKRSEKRSKEYIVQYKNNQEFKIKNLDNFCKEQKLHRGNLSQILRGEKSHHRGWKIRYAHEITWKFINKRKFEIEYLNNTKEIVISLIDFCTKHNYDYNGLFSRKRKRLLESYQIKNIKRIHDI